MRKRRDISLFAVLSLLPIALAACSDTTSSTDPRTQHPLVRTATVTTADQMERSFTGVVAARVQSNLGFRVPGKITERLVDTGQTIVRGQPLMRIDDTDLRLATRAREEAVAATAARAHQAAEEEERYRVLVSRGAVSESAYDAIKEAADSARAELNAAEARADVARNEENYAVLLADADGVVVETLAEPGQVVDAGQTVVRVAHAGQREAVIELPETLRPAIGSTGWATLYGTGLAGAATLRQLSDSANQLTRTYEARYVLEGALGEAPLGSTVTVQIPDTHNRTSATLQVPIRSIHDPGNGPGVWVIEGTPTTVHWQPVTIMHLDDATARVTGKLAAGDRVVALGAQLLHADEEVRVADTRESTGELSRE